MTLDELRAAAGLPDSAAWSSAAGVVWSRDELLNLPWVAEWRAGWADGELFAARAIDRYGDAIPADTIVMEAVAVDFQGMETVGHEASWVHASHVCDFAGHADLGAALRALYRAGWVVPLLDGTVVAPRLVLRPAHTLTRLQCLRPPGD